MDYRRLGKTDLRVSALGLGCSRLGSVTQAAGDKAALRLIATAVEAGINFFDTADIYGQGRSETLLGQVLHHHRDKVVIATKAGYCLSAMGALARRFKPFLRRLLKFKPGLTQAVQKARSAQTQQNFAPDYLAAQVEASLRRLKTDALDLFYLHSPPADILARDEVFARLEDLKRQGKIRHYGVSCLAVNDTVAALAHPGVEALQLELNLLRPEALPQVLPSVHSAKVGLVAREAFAGGSLLHPASDLKPDAYPTPEQYRVAHARLRELEILAAETGCQVAELALKALLQHAEISSVLVGTTSLDHLQEHLAALERPAPSTDLLARMPKLRQQTPA